MEKLFKTIEYDFTKWLNFVKGKKIKPLGGKADYIIITGLDEVGIEKDSGNKKTWVKGTAKAGSATVEFGAKIVPEGEQETAKSKGSRIDGYFLPDSGKILHWVEPSEIQKDIEYFNSIKGVPGVPGSKSPYYSEDGSVEVEFTDRDPVSGQVKFIVTSPKFDAPVEGQDFLVRPDYNFVDFLEYGFTKNTPEAIKKRIEDTLTKLKTAYPAGDVILDGVKSFVVIEPIYDETTKKFGLKMKKDYNDEVVVKNFKPGSMTLDKGKIISKTDEIDFFDMDTKSSNAKQVTVMLKSAGFPIEYSDIYWAKGEDLKLDLVFTEPIADDKLSDLDNALDTLKMGSTKFIRTEGMQSGNLVTYVLSKNVDESKNNEYLIKSLVNEDKKVRDVIKG